MHPWPVRWREGVACWDASFVVVVRYMYVCSGLQVRAGRLFEAWIFPCGERSGWDAVGRVSGKFNAYRDAVVCKSGVWSLFIVQLI